MGRAVIEDLASLSGAFDIASRSLRLTSTIALVSPHSRKRVLEKANPKLGFRIYKSRNETEVRPMAIKETFESVAETIKEAIGSETESAEGEDSGYESSGEFKREFTKQLKDRLEMRIEEQAVRPLMEIWPYDDEDAQWYAYHSDKSRVIICNTPEFKDLPFCGSGFH
jgi:hypothetical protein